MRSILPFVSVLALAGCNAAASEADPGPTASKSFALSGFDQVSLRGSDDVSVSIGERFSVTASGPQNLLDELELSVEGGVLKIGRKSRTGISFGNNPGAKVTVTMPAIKGAVLGGSGDMMIAAAASDGFDASVAGSGTMRVTGLQAAAVSASVAGSGDLLLGGAAKSIKASIAGSGDVQARDLAADTADVSIAGSGNASVRASQSAAVSLMGSGDVEVVGIDRCKVSKMGSGEVRCAKQ